MIEIYTDGACSGNPGPGGWGALLRMSQVETEMCGGEPATTNNRNRKMGSGLAIQHFAARGGLARSSPSPHTKLPYHLERAEIEGQVLQIDINGFLGAGLGLRADVAGGRGPVEARLRRKADTD